MRVVVVSPYVPFRGIDHAGGAYLEAYLELSTAQREVELFAPRSEENARGAREHATSAQVHLVEVPPEPTSTLHRRWWNARNVCRGLTPGWQILRALRRDERLRESLSHCDLLEVHWDYMLPVLDHLPRDLPVVSFPYDVVAQVFTRRASTASLPGRLVHRNLASRVRRQEVAYLNRVDCTFVFSDKDVGLLRDAGLRGPAVVLDPLVDLPGAPAELDGSHILLFVAAMHRPENIDAVEWFLSTIWSEVHRQVPSARFVVAGSRPPARLGYGVPGVEVTGFVEDLSILYRSARAAVVPLRSGAGLKFKVAQAMLWGLPVVTTSVGAEGIVEHAGLASFAAVSDDPAALIRACVEVLTNATTARATGDRARAWALSAYDTSASIQRVLDRQETLISARAH